MGCDDTDASVSIEYSVDADGDGRSVEVHCAPDHPPRTRQLLPPAPATATTRIRTPSTCNLNADGDGYAASTEVSVCADSMPPGYGIYLHHWADCDDSRADVFAFGLEQWTDGVDSDCDGFQALWGCDDADCECALDPVAVDESCGIANLYVEGIPIENVCYRIEWSLVVGNDGTQAVSDWTLTMTDGETTVTYPMADELEQNRGCGSTT